MVWVSILWREHGKTKPKVVLLSSRESNLWPLVYKAVGYPCQWGSTTVFSLGEGLAATYKYKPVCYYKHWLFYVHSKVICRKSIRHLLPTLKLTSPSLIIFWILQFKSVCIQSWYVKGTFPCVGNGKNAYIWYLHIRRHFCDVIILFWRNQYRATWLF